MFIYCLFFLVGIDADCQIVSEVPLHNNLMEEAIAAKRQGVANSRYPLGDYNMAIIISDARDKAAAKKMRQEWYDKFVPRNVKYYVLRLPLI